MKQFVMLAIMLSLTSLAPSQEAATQTTDTAREQRIKEHEARVQAIMNMNRLVQSTRPTTQPLPQISDPVNFERFDSPLLTEAGVSKDQLEKLGSIQKQIRELAATGKPPYSDEVTSKAKTLVDEYAAVLTPEQRDTFRKLYAARVEELRKKTQTSGSVEVK